MTVQERVLASRIIQKIDVQKEYAERIGLSYTLEPVKIPEITIQFKTDRSKEI